MTISENLNPVSDFILWMNKIKHLTKYTLNVSNLVMTFSSCNIDVFDDVVVTDAWNDGVVYENT